MAMFAVEYTYSDATAAARDEHREAQDAAALEVAQRVGHGSAVSSRTDGSGQPARGPTGPGH